MKKIILFFILAFMVFGNIFAEKFLFKYVKGSKYRYLSELEADTFLDGFFEGKVNQLYKIAYKISDVKNGIGLLDGKFIISEREEGSNQPFRLIDEAESIYWIDQNGLMDVPLKYYFPNTRNVPYFPDREIKKGEEWTAAGEEAHDLRAWDISEPFHSPITVNYKYLGKEEYEGIECDLISVKYNVFHRPPHINNPPAMYPARIRGYSEQLLYWNNEKGLIQGYEEEFDLVYEFGDGSTYEATGYARSKLIEAEEMDTEKITDDIRKDIEKQGLRDTSVRKDDEGITITLSNIQFPPDSAVLVLSEQDKLRGIAEILKRYPDRDIRITGHTALAGTEEGRSQLSLERAEAVGSFLLDLEVRTQDRMIINGMGADAPIADNRTEEGRRQNRRVEITILEN